MSENTLDKIIKKKNERIDLLKKNTLKYCPLLLRNYSI